MATRHQTRTRRAATAIFAVLLLAVSAPALASASADPDQRLKLGPNIIRTNEAPTGHSVTFRYDAPDDIESVQIWGEWQFSQPDVIVDLNTPEGRWGWEWKPGDIPASIAAGWQTAQMTKGADGIWEWTTPLPSGTFHYFFLHNCASPVGSGCPRVIDPANPGWASQLTPTGAQTISQVYVPSHKDFPTYDNDYQEPSNARQAGTLEHVRYVSPASTNPPGEHYMVVYTPKGYDPDRPTPYPTLYLSHGGAGSEGDWSTQGAAGHIVENALRDHEALPMVVVMTNFNGLAGNVGYANDVAQNVIPYMEANYNVSTEAADRAFGGLSLGGARGLALLYDFTPMFEYYGLWSTAVFGAGGNPNAAQIERMMGVSGEIQMGTGLQDFLGNIGAGSVARVQLLRNAGIAVTEHNMNGMHTWDVWRNLLNRFIREVAFRATTTTVGGVQFDDRRATLTAAVAPLGTSIASPTGSVEFFDGDGNRLGSARVGSDGVAELVVRNRGALDDIQARYSGSRMFNGSES